MSFIDDEYDDRSWGRRPILAAAAQARRLPLGRESTSRANTTIRFAAE